MATIDYTATITADKIKSLSNKAISYWTSQVTSLQSQLSSLGPRPVDEKNYLNEWAKLDREIAAINVRIADLHILAMHSGDCQCSFTSDQLRELYPELLNS